MYSRALQIAVELCLYVNIFVNVLDHVDYNAKVSGRISPRKVMAVGTCPWKPRSNC